MTRCQTGPYLGADAQPDHALHLGPVNLLVLEVDVLQLLVTLVREGNCRQTELSQKRSSQQLC